MDNTETELAGINTAAGPHWFYWFLCIIVGMGIYIAATYGLSMALPAGSPLLTPLLGVTSVICLGGTAYGLGLRTGRVTLADWGLRPWRWQWLWAAVAVGASAILLPARALLGLAVEFFLNGNIDSVQARGELLSQSGASWSGFLLTLLGIAILVPIGEELFFRGLLHGLLTKFVGGGFWVRALLSSAVFGAAHFDSLGVVASSFVLGLVCAALYERTRSIIPSILAHMATNGAAVALLYASLWATAQMAASGG